MRGCTTESEINFNIFCHFSIITEAEINFYEIPVAKGSETESLPTENDYEETTISPTSIDKEKEELSTNPVPPPLPPRRERTASDTHSRSSCGSILDEIKPNLTLRPQLTPKSEIYQGSSERLVDESCGMDHIIEILP